MASRSPPRLWPLYAVNFFMADMQSGIGPFVGVFLQERGWATGLIGTALTIGNVAGMLVTTPIGGFIDLEPQQAPVGRHSRHLRGACVRDHPDLATFLGGHVVASSAIARERCDRAGGHRASRSASPGKRASMR